MKQSSEEESSKAQLDIRKFFSNRRPPAGNETAPHRTANYGFHRPPWMTHC